jgi:hypothetical protein
MKKIHFALLIIILISNACQKKIEESYFNGTFSNIAINGDNYVSRLYYCYLQDLVITFNNDNTCIYKDFTGTIKLSYSINNRTIYLSNGERFDIAYNAKEFCTKIDETAIVNCITDEDNDGLDDTFGYATGDHVTTTFTYKFGKQ